MKLIEKDQFVRSEAGFILTIQKTYRAVFGLGEKFDSVNQKGKQVRACVREKCFYQEEYTYLSMPFFLTPDGFGIFVDTYAEVEFDFREENKITVLCHFDTMGRIPKVYLLEGTPKQVLGEFRTLAGLPRLFPKWVLGSWMSSNRWRKQSEVEEQLMLTKEYGFPHNVLVIEPWSDLTTSYLWEGSHIPHKKGNEFATIEEVDYSESEEWPNPQKMIENMHTQGIRTLLWVVPVYAQGISIEGRCNLNQCASDNAYVRQSGECVLNSSGTPYEIPHTWCIGSMLPDFTDEVGAEHWFNRFRHLLSMGIDGFKTDGGEFVHNTDVVFRDGTTGIEGQNAYAEQYTRAFAEFVGKDRVVFSRAGGPRSPEFSIVWAGDQESTWSEYASVVKAGISAGLSGVSCWGYDIAGFAGYLPSEELYLRATQTAVFLPVMQWHSEPVSNGRCDFTGAWKTNDRSPWNMSAFHKKPELLELLRKQYFLHYNLIPYQYSLMAEASRTGISAIRHLCLEFPEDDTVYSIEDEFMLGSALLVAPVLEDYSLTRQVYFPEGDWYDLHTGKAYSHGWMEIELTREYCPAFVRKNACIPLNLSEGKLCSDVGNSMDGYHELTFLVNGEGTYDFADDLGNEIVVRWTDSSSEVIRNTLTTPVYFMRIGVNALPQPE